MKIDIYFADNHIQLSDEKATAGCLVLQDCPTVSELLSLFEQNPEIVVLCSDVNAAFECFMKDFKAVKAAGGLVEAEGKALLIYRNGRWDLPKGHWEEGESIEECALREVEEETGVQNISIESKLCITLHAYKKNGAWEMKFTHWYSMRSDEATNATPQQEEGIERAEWFGVERLEELTIGSFPTIRNVIQARK